MYDELIKDLRENHDKYFARDMQAADAIKELSKQHEAQRQNLIALMDEKPRWISVEERLPEAGERVLCDCRANIYEVMKMRTDGDWVCDTNHVYMHSFVTHWMPLPQAPEEE